MIKTTKQVEYQDRNHEVMTLYYDLCENASDIDKQIVKRKLTEFMDKDPEFLDSYLYLRNIYLYEENEKEADRLLDDAFSKAIEIITDEEGNWPDMLEWAWLENRHIIRTILNKALKAWEKKDTDEALGLLRKLLRTNPGDNVGSRNFILAIRMNMSYDEFEDTFDKGGYYDMDLIHWFDKNYTQFPDEFDWWEKAMEKYY